MINPNPTPLSIAPGTEQLDPKKVLSYGFFDWLSEGIPWITIREGDTINLLESHDKWTEVECGPAIGSVLDPEKNPTVTEYGHFMWLWYENEVTGYDGCIGVSRYEDWGNMPERRPVYRDSDYNRLRVDDSSSGDDLVFFRDTEDRNYSMPPLRGAVFAVPHDGGIRYEDKDELQWCIEGRVPLAFWTVERGFVGVTREDMQAFFGRGEEFHADEVEEARRHGWFLVRFDSGTVGCWQVGKPRGRSL